MRLGIVARSDRGGLAAQTFEVWRHLQPERVLLVDLGPSGRGPSDLARFPDALVHSGPGHLIPERTVDAFCDGLDVVWSAETFYTPDFADRARRAGARTVLHANPELWRTDLAAPDVVWAPTTWELRRLPAGTRVVPHPVATDVLRFRQRDQVRAFVHIAAPAFHDRNGTRLTLAACRRVRVHSRMLVRGQPRLARRLGMVDVIGQASSEAWYHQAWPDQADVLVLPRRYAGLSLPMAEAAALGMPVVALDVEPQRSWLPAEGLVRPSPRPRVVSMVGGKFPVHDAPPSAVAAVMERLVREPELVAKLSAASGEWAAAHSWDALGPVWERELALAADG